MPSRLPRRVLRHPIAVVTTVLVVTATLALFGPVSSARSLGAGPFSGDVGSLEDGSLVQTDRGPVRGFAKSGVAEFLGIPYAAPPVGDLRWRPPEPHARWQAPLDAKTFGPTCPQSNELAVFAGPTSISEDCLYLNVFAPSQRRAGSGALPVLVWIHGGGDWSGESNDYDAGKLALAGSGTIVVTLNYRLGLLGFLSQDALNAEGHPWGNYGILDQQAALRWVQSNIAAFGGDPQRVTLGGQSSGAVNTGANLVSPSAKGLFHRAILQSGFFPVLDTAADALAHGNGFAGAAGCPTSGPAAADCLRKQPVARILQLQGTLAGNGPYVGALQAMVDGTVVPEQPITAWTDGTLNKMPVMGGFTSDEPMFTIGIKEYFSSATGTSGPPLTAMTPQQYTDAVTAQYGARARAVLDEYPLSKYDGDPSGAWNRVSSDPVKCGLSLSSVQVLAKAVPVYAYDFTYQNAPFFMPAMPDPYDRTGNLRPRAAHTIDIQFVFPGFHGGPLGVNLDQTSGQPRELNADESHLSDRLVELWTNFAATGNPNGQGDSPWPAFTPDSPKYLRADIPLSTETGAEFRARYNCGFWESLNK